MKFLPWTKCLLTSGVLWRHITSTRQLVYHNFLWLSELLFWLEVHVNFPSLKNIFFNYSDSTLVHIMDRVMHLKASDNTVHDFGEMCLPSTQCLLLSAMFQRLMTSTRQLMYQYLLLFLTSLICQHHIERTCGRCDTLESPRRSVWVKCSQGWTVRLNHVLFFAVCGAPNCPKFVYSSNIFHQIFWPMQVKRELVHPDLCSSLSPCSRKQQSDAHSCKNLREMC